MALAPDILTPTYRQAVERLSEYLSRAGFCFPGADEEDAAEKDFVERMKQKTGTKGEVKNG